MKLPNKWYDILKWVAMVLIPAVQTLIFTLGQLLGFDATVVCGILAAVHTFLGALIGVSTFNYNKEQREDGKDEKEV